MAGLGTLGVTWGDPWSAFTYSGVPWHLFAELDRAGALAGRADADQTRTVDLARGALDVRRSVGMRRPKRNALWRYLPEAIDLLGRRFAEATADAPPHDAVLQFGVAGIPRSAPLVAHVEIPVEVAVSTPVFARSYGFTGFDDRTIARAIEGERAFLAACSVVWTNSPWTAAALESPACPASKIRWYPPGCGFADPGPIERDWSRCHVLFIGKDWERKGGPELVDAFRQVRGTRSDARLTVIGCSPDVAGPGIDVLGYLRKDVPADAERLHDAVRAATIFCMPSLWESTGLVYMEAALYGLPVIMVGGQGRDQLFPEGCLALDDRRPERLAAALLDLASEPDRMRAMGAAGRRLVLERYMWPTVAARVTDFIAEARAITQP